MQDHDQYRLFLHLVSTLSFTRTAADCHTSPATLSRTVQRLEAATGHRLLDRARRASHSPNTATASAAMPPRPWSYGTVTTTTTSMETNSAVS
jgi:hypothetical protein